MCDSTILPFIYLVTFTGSQICQDFQCKMSWLLGWIPASRGFSVCMHILWDLTMFYVIVRQMERHSNKTANMLTRYPNAKLPSVTISQNQFFRMVYANRLVWYGHAHSHTA